MNSKILNPTHNKSTGFNMIHKENPFNSMFDIRPIEDFEKDKIKEIIVNGNSKSEMGHLSSDAESLIKLTSEIKSIGRQAVLLIGERVSEARSILKDYRQGTFTKWLIATFGAKRSGYNALCYFDLYNNLPDGSRSKFKKLNPTTAYVLASRRGKIDVKAEIIEEAKNKSHEEIISVIQEKLPLPENDKRTRAPSIDNVLRRIRLEIETLERYKDLITEEHILTMTGFIDSIQKILKDI